MKRPFDEIVDNYSENLARVRENQIRNFENSEKFMVWIVGFSIGGLSLIVSNLTTLNSHYDPIVIKTVLIALAVSIIAGIIYRWSFYSFQIQYQQIEFYLKGAFSNKRMMPTSGEDLSTQTDYRFMVWKFEKDFGVDWNHTIEAYENGDEGVKEFFLNDIRIAYNNMSELAANDFAIAIRYVDDVNKKAFSLSDKEIEKLKNRNAPKLLKIFGKITIAGFVISCLSFVFVIILLTILY